MVNYKIFIKPSAVKELEKIPQKVVIKIKNLALDPRPSGCEKLSSEEKYRIRHGNYRIVYAIEDEKLIIIVVKIWHRRDIN